nr:PREDICTED: very long-chain acyl-CoA synthetase-like [Lepisosteus oculatus]
MAIKGWISREMSYRESNWFPNRRLRKRENRQLKLLLKQWKQLLHFKQWSEIFLCKVPVAVLIVEKFNQTPTGEGLRHDVWKEFAERFGVYGITESYGSTESNVRFINYTGKIGAIGRAGFLNKLMFPFEFLKYDVLKEEVVRDEIGRCVKAKKGEVGLLVSQVTNQNPFCGYAGSVEQTQKKLLRNDLKEGDVYYNSGDLMKVDKDGFVYFCDRVGDTFRWKAENVSTTEVDEILEEMKRSMCMEYLYQDMKAR